MRIFVGCSSRNEIAKDYFSLAEEVGKLLTFHEIIIGGTEEGMMGNVIKKHRHFKRIILKDYVKEDTPLCSDDIICKTSFERLESIWQNTDLFLFLPGGTGTLGEMLTFLEENRTKKQKKKIIILNYEHYYDSIVDFVRRAGELQFCNRDILDGIIFIENIQKLENEIID